MLIVCAALFVTVMARKKIVTRPSDYIIVAGANVRPDGSPSNALKNRLEAAFSAYSRGYGGSVIVCGARGKDEPVSEARAMRDYLIGLGVSPNAILLEEQSVNTVSNIKNARALMPKGATCVIVTSDYHMFRALLIARIAGVDASGYKAKSRLRPATYVSCVFREALSIYYFIIKLIFNRL